MANCKKYITETQNRAESRAFQFNFQDVKVFRQLDSKFICCTSRCSNSTKLYLLDQHAIHERVCLERLLKYHVRKDRCGNINIKSSVCHPPVKLELKFEVSTSLESFQDQLWIYGIQLKFLKEKCVEITHIPTCLISETFKANPGKLKLLLQNFVEDVSSNISKARISIPATLENVLSTFACRGALKFGDSLSRRQACQLVKELGGCNIPFQCAHGRPSVAHIPNFEDFTSISIAMKQKPNYNCLQKLF